VYTRAEERESAADYQACLGSHAPSAALARFLMGPVGSFLVNTPLFLLPRRFRISADQRVLDIGCGRGAALRFLAGRVHFRRRPVGIDIAPAVVAQAAAEMGPDRPAELAAAAATRLPFAEDSFDLILASYVVKHLGDQAMHRFLFECWRVLKPGGALVVWEFAPTRSPLLNRFHQWLLTQQVSTCRLRGYGDFVDLAVESSFADMEILALRPFLFPPIPRTGFVLKKGSAKGAPPAADASSA
jgi:SAM-dependent methyltransferase